MYVGRRAVRASIFAARGMRQCRNIDVIDAVRRREVVPYVLAVFVRENDRADDGRSRVVVNQPHLVLCHVVRWWERLYVQRQIRRIRHVDVYKGRERLDLGAILWKRFADSYEKIVTKPREREKIEREKEKIIY